jgi:hypothetical protein
VSALHGIAQLGQQLHALLTAAAAAAACAALHFKACSLTATFGLQLLPAGFLTLQPLRYTLCEPSGQQRHRQRCFSHRRRKAPAPACRASAARASPSSCPGTWGTLRSGTRCSVGE